MNGIHVFLDVLLKPTGDTTANLINNFWAKVIPAQSAWIDNYVSEVGLLHTEAANVLLWRESTLNPFKPHGYSYGWYQQTVGNPTASDMGHRWSFERDTLGSAPMRGTYFLQSALVNRPELEVVEISDSLAAALAGGYGVGLNRFVTYPTLKAYQGLAELGSLAAGGVKDGVRYAGSFIGSIVESFTPLTGQPVFVGTANATPAYYVQPSVSSTFQAGWDLQFTLQIATTPHLGLRAKGSPSPLDGGGETNTPVYVWLPVSIPRDAVGLTFEFRVEGASTNEYFAMGITNENYFTMEAKFLDDGVWTATSVIDTSDYARQDMDLFFSLNGAGPPTGKLSVRGIQFYSPSAPNEVCGKQQPSSAFLAGFSDWLAA